MKTSAPNKVFVYQLAGMKAGVVVGTCKRLRNIRVARPML